MFDGHTTKLVPNLEKNTLSPQIIKKPKVVLTGEQFLIFFVLLLFSINIIMIVTKFSYPVGITDGIPTPSFTATVFNSFIKLFAF